MGLTGIHHFCYNLHCYPNGSIWDIPWISWMLKEVPCAPGDHGCRVGQPAAAQETLHQTNVFHRKIPWKILFWNGWWNGVNVIMNGRQKKACRVEVVVDHFEVCVLLDDVAKCKEKRSANACRRIFLVKFWFWEDWWCAGAWCAFAGDVAFGKCWGTIWFYTWQLQYMHVYMHVYKCIDT